MRSGVPSSSPRTSTTTFAVLARLDQACRSRCSAIQTFIGDHIRRFAPFSRSINPIRASLPVR